MTAFTLKSHRKRIVLILGIILAFATGALLYMINTPPAPISNHPPPTKDPTTHVTKTSPEATFGLPMRLQIPKLKVDAHIAYMGLTKDGDMDVPPDLLTVGWYKFGTKPGNLGSAVLAGHLEGTKELGVFTDLNKLRPGDTVKVLNDRDEVLSFAVRDTRTYKQTDHPAEVFNKTDGTYLNLITCSGTWNTSEQRYSHRLVVFTEKVQ